MTLAASSRGRAPSRGQVICCAALLTAVLIFLYEYSTFCFPSTILPKEWAADTVSSPSSDFLADFGNQSKELYQLGTLLLPSINNIIFIETSCAIERRPPGGLKLSAKQACSIYSAARHNPTRKVVLLYTCPLSRSFYRESSDSVRTIFDLPNFALSEVNLTEFLAGTPLAAFADGPLRRSSFTVEHAADALRYLAVYFYGGTYMDLDIVSLKPLDDIGTNYIVAQDTGGDYPPILANGVFNFEPRHGFMKECVQKVYEEYDPEKWSTIGPELVTKALRNFCNLSDETRLDEVGTISSCNVTIKNQQTFYAIKYWSWNEYYREGAWPEVERQLSGAFGAHVWNHMGSVDIIIGGTQPYGILAEKNCYAVYVRAGAHFKR